MKVMMNTFHYFCVDAIRGLGKLGISRLLGPGLEYIVKLADRCSGIRASVDGYRS